MQFLQRLFVVRMIFCAEALKVAKASGIDDIHNAPEIGQLILDRRTSKPQGEIGVHGLGRARQKRRWRLDLLHLVEYGADKGHGSEAHVVVAQRLVCGKNPIRLLNSPVIECRCSAVYIAGAGRL